MSTADEPRPVNLEDAFYTAVGMAILGFQQLQVARRDLPDQLRSAATRLDEELSPILDDFEAALPEAARERVHRFRIAARELQETVLGTAGENSPDDQETTDR